MKKSKYLPIAVILAAILFSSCPAGFEGTIRSEARTLYLDVDNRIFSPSDAADTQDRGPGALSLTFSAVVKDGSTETETDPVTLEAANLDTVWNYTRVSLPIEAGVLQEVRAVITTAEGETPVILDSYSDTDLIDGWQTFENLLRFGLGCTIDTADPTLSEFFLYPCPAGGNSAVLLTDSGVTDPDYAHTDRGGSLSTKQISLQPVLKEYPDSVTLDFYTAIVDTDLREANDPARNFDATYLDYQWADVWTVEEITDTGKRIDQTRYKLYRYTTAELDAADPEGDGLKSVLIDLTAETNDPTGKFLLIGWVIRWDDLAVPGEMNIVEIK